MSQKNSEIHLFIEPIRLTSVSEINGVKQAFIDEEQSMKLFRKAFFLTAAMSAMFSFWAFAGDTPTGVSIEQSGCDFTINWNAPDFDGIDKYQVQVYKVKDSTKKESADTKAKTLSVDGDDTSVDTSVSSKGYYYAKVRMRDVNNKWHSWSEASSRVTVTSDDVKSRTHDPSGGTSYVSPSGTGTVIYTENYTGGNTAYNSQGTLYNTATYGPTAGNIASQGLAKLNDPNSMNPTINNVYSSSSTVANTKYVSAFTYLKTGWQFEQQGMWYLYDDGTYPVSCWRLIDGAYYHFNPSGYLEVNTWVLESNGWRYSGADGKMCTGWQMINNKWYYFNTNDGVLQGPGLITVDNKFYYIQHDGSRVQNNWVNGYYYGADGALTNG